MLKMWFISGAPQGPFERGPMAPACLSWVAKGARFSPDFWGKQHFYYAISFGINLMKIRPSGWVALAVLLALLIPLPAFAQDWSANWPAAESGAPIDGAADITLDIPSTLSAETLSALAVELDSFDVTAYVQISGGQLAISPPEPLASGPHVLRLVEYQVTGVIERGSWTFQAIGSGPEISLEGNLSAEYVRRIAENNLEDPKPGLETGSGTVDLRGSVSSGDWTLESDVQALLDSRQDQTLSGDVAEGNFRIAADYAGQNLDVAAQLGRHGIKANNLLMSGFQRRGASLTSSTKQDRLSVSVFAHRPDDAVEFENMLGLSDSDNLITGTHVTWQPFEQLAEKFIVSGTYYDGQGQSFGQNGFGQVLADERDSGGYAFAANTYWFDDRLYIAGEVAETENNYGFGDQDSDATSAEIRYNLFRDTQIGDMPLNLNVGVKYSAIGTLFSSLANQGLASDVETLQYYSTAYLGGLSTQVQASRVTNNVDDFAVLPTDELWTYQFVANYTPNWSDPPKWIGSPSFYANGSWSDGDRKRAPVEFAGFDFDQKQKSITAGMSSSYGKWGWTAGYGYSSFEDLTDVNSDRDQHNVDLGLSLSLWDRLSLNPYVRWSQFEDQDFNLEDDNWDMSLSGQVLWIPDALDTSFNATVNLQSGDNAFADTYTVNTTTTWVFLKPEPNRPGAAIDLSAVYQNNDFIFGQEFEQFQAFARLKLMMPIQYLR